MNKAKTVLENISGFFKGVFDADPAKKITGCCGGYAAKTLTRENSKKEVEKNA
ncbi:MAG: hypothetical protein LBH29_02590 [Elusimicrobiota bacterium]|jgi:hypothetical protein|nr:hypothetical protein [Elusimicrobiota bacterium]